MHNFYLMAFCLMLSSLTISAQNEVRKENFQVGNTLPSPTLTLELPRMGYMPWELLVLHSTCRTWVLPFTTSR